MRAPALFALHLAFPAALLAQGWIIPRVPIRPPVCEDKCIAFPVALERTSSNVRATLADHVLRYEVEETFRNRGGTVQEADYMYPLPAGAAFQELQLSINGQLVSGEIMDAGRARSTCLRAKALTVSTSALRIPARSAFSCIQVPSSCS